MSGKLLPESFCKRKWLLIGCLLLSPYLFAQTKVSGVVKDQHGQSIPGANILVKGTSNGVVTAADGTFTIDAPADGVLSVSFIGYASKEVLIGGQTSLEIMLEEDITSLSEVVVVGYGTVKKSDLTGSVASVSSRKLQEVITVDVNNALQGRVAGVQVVNNSGRPGAGTTVRIRGVGSFGSSDPLYVVDGFPTGDISFLAPADIESMEVLKDASASAIYGNRGSNGVILITTKKGKEGAPAFNFSVFAGVQTPVKKLDLLNARQYSQLYLEAVTNDGLDATSVGEQPYAMLTYAIDNNLKGTDWQDEVMNEVAPIQNYSFDVSGGTNRNRYRFSATYFDQEGNVKNSYLEKLFIKFNNDLTFSEKIKGGFNVSYLRAKVGNYNGDQYSGVLPVAIGTSPVTPAFDYDPLFNSWGEAQFLSQGNNPARIVDEAKNQGWDQHKFISNFWGEIQLLEGLSFRSNFSSDLSFDHSKNYYPEFNIRKTPAERRQVSELNESRGTNFSWNWSNYLTYQKAFGDHSVNVMGGQEANLAQWSSISGRATLVPADPSQQFLGASKATEALVGSGQGEVSLLSFFGRVNYSYKSRYALTVTGRYDGSSRFAKGNQWGFFPSFAAAWNVTNEDFMQHIAVISQLKVRAGYGEVGNQAVLGVSDYITTVTNQQRYSFNNNPVEGRIPTTLSNPELIWESSNMINVGIDWGFLDDKLNLTTEYFIRDTEDMLVTVPIPEYVGAYAPKANAGTMRNSGFEFSVLYKSTVGELKYDVGLNMSFINNELMNLGGGQPFESGNVNKVGNTTKVEEGMPFPYFFGYQTDGIFNTEEELAAYVNGDGLLIQPNAKPGDVKFRDINNNGAIDPGDRVNLGNPFPKYSGGFSIGLEYKSFDLKAFLVFSGGHQVVNSLIRWNEDVTGILNSTTNRLDRWTASNTTSNEPRMTRADANENMRFSDRYVEDGDLISLRNIQLGYNLPASLNTKLHLKAVRIYVSADNLIRWTDYKGFDPEFGALYTSPFYSGVDLANYPQPRTVVGGINVTF